MDLWTCLYWIGMGGSDVQDEKAVKVLG